jgi:hypothetical protein
MKFGSRQAYLAWPKPKQRHCSITQTVHALWRGRDFVRQNEHFAGKTRFWGLNSRHELLDK